MTFQWPRTAIAVAVPAVFLAVAVLQWSRRNSSSVPEAGSTAIEKSTRVAEKSIKAVEKAVAKPKAKAAVKKHKPKSYPRYFLISLLIRALEHDSSRKAVVGVLKIAQKRA